MKSGYNTSNMSAERMRIVEEICKKIELDTHNSRMEDKDAELLELIQMHIEQYYRGEKSVCLLER